MVIGGRFRSVETDRQWLGSGLSASTASAPASFLRSRSPLIALCSFETRRSSETGDHSPVHQCYVDTGAICVG